MSESPPEGAIIGVISDTHGSIPPEAIEALAGVDHIIHAGDVVSPTAVDDLRRLAPVTVVRGNMDSVEVIGRVGKTAVATVAGLAFYVLHDLDLLDLDPAAAGFDAVVHGHTHRPDIEWRSGVLFLNPGSASRPRGGGPTVAIVEAREGTLIPRIVSLG